MSKKRYMELLLEQIRNKRAKELVSREIESHIEDQKEDYLAQGFTDYDAERRAVLDMGDPVETGVSLDAVHRPEMSWSMVILTAVISMIGFLFIAVLCQEISGHTIFVKKQACFILIGFCMMLLICKIDYSRIFQKPGILVLIYFSYIILLNTGLLEEFLRNVGIYYSFCASVTIPYLFSIPVFCSLLYRFRRKCWYHLLIPAGFMVLSVIIIGQQWQFASYKVFLTLICAILVSIVICKDWYPVNKKVFLPILWSCMIGIPAILLLIPARFPDLFPNYFFNRLSHWLYPFFSSQNPQSMVQQVVSKSWVVGHSSTLVMDFNSLISDYMLVNVTAHYGMVITGILLVLFIVFCGRLFYLALHQKNQLGMIVGLGCSFSLTMEILKYFLMNFGIIPMTNGFLPLFSYGGSVTIVSFIFIGILLSIYRNQNLISENRPKRFRIRLKIEQEL